ncbi:MAG: SAM-dependent methyltransferase [Synechococcus sp. TMED169]|nr:MAG: SAM-dependent methyltransferase [Synechococcus sp. TMED169]
MLQRQVEPELMNATEQVEAYAAADFSHSDQALVQWMARRFPAGLGNRVIDLGCGPGNIAFLLVQLWHQIEVLGVDGAPNMLAVAQERAKSLVADQAKRLRWQQACLPDLTLPGGFSAVVSNSLLHHLHDPAVLWQSVRQLAAPECVVVIHDLRRPPSEAQLQGLVQRHAADAPPVLKRDYEASLRAAFSIKEVQQQLLNAGLPQLQVMEREDRYLTVWGRLG